MKCVPVSCLGSLTPRGFRRVFLLLQAGVCLFSTLLSLSFFEDLFYYLFIMCISMYVVRGWGHVVCVDVDAVSSEARIGHWIPWSWSSRQL